ncbi:hypothetical protein CN918_31125 [Priestia megaterium]|nr:hypothetical protein CN918_31125 [Priestia megaterium]
MTGYSYAKRCQSAATENNLYSATLLTNSKEKAKYEELTGFQLNTFDEIKQITKKQGIDPTNIYFMNSQDSDNPYVYYDFPILIYIMDMSELMLDFLDISKRIELQSERFQRFINENDYEALFNNVDEKLQISALNKWYDEIPENEQYKWFRKVYTTQNYSHLFIEPRIIQDAINKRPKDVITAMQEKLNSLTDTDEIVVYRGMLSQSTPAEKSYSWTCELAVAARFAARLGQIGEIVKGSIKKNDVLDYIPYNKEEEILVLPGTVFDIKVVTTQVHPEKQLEHLANNFLLTTYHKHFLELDRYLFDKPDSIHGVSHSRRVMLIAQSIGLELELDDNEFRVLELAAAYHDIGRKHDEEDDSHGFESWNKIKNVGLLEEFMEHHELYDNDMELLRIIIEYHPLKDNELFKEINKSAILDKVRAKLVATIFKDSDALDRMRIGDLDTTYLRLDVAHNFVLFTSHINRQIK